MVGEQTWAHGRGVANVQAGQGMAGHKHSPSTKGCTKEGCAQQKPCPRKLHMAVREDAGAMQALLLPLLAQSNSKLNREKLSLAKTT
jgi:hypothetical protein